MEVAGYKVLDSNMCNMYGKKFELNKSYKVEGPIKFGTHGNGYHFCKNFEDTLKYSLGYEDGINVIEVIGKGDIIESFDRYNGFYDLYVAREIELIRKLERKEILDKAIIMNEMKLIRFLSLYQLDDKEKIYFIKNIKKLSLGVIQTFDFYQNNNIEAFNNPWNYLSVDSKGYVRVKEKSEIYG